MTSRASNMDSAMIAHWAGQYIGQRWESGANGPDAWDCGTFVRHVQRTHYGRAIPHAFADASNIHAVVRALAGLDLGDWDEMPAPRDGDGVILAHARYGSHVGVWIDVDGGGVLHCQNGAGVIFTPAAKLAPSGWGRVKFYRPGAR